MKKIAIPILVICLVIVIATYFYFSGKEYVFTFSENQIHEKLVTKLPLTKTYFIIFEVTLNNPRVTLVNGSDRVAAGLDVILNIRINKEPKPLGGSIDATGGIKYVAKDGTFFLTNPVINDFAIQGIPDRYTEKANQVLTKALSEYYEEHPIYELRASDVKHAVARLVLKDVIIENQQLIVTLGI